MKEFSDSRRRKKHLYRGVEYLEPQGFSCSGRAERNEPTELARNRQNKATLCSICAGFIAAALGPQIQDWTGVELAGDPAGLVRQPSDILILCLSSNKMVLGRAACDATRCVPPIDD